MGNGALPCCCRPPALIASVPSVACSSPEALAWDESFQNLNDPSGRAVANVHDDAYDK